MGPLHATATVGLCVVLSGLLVLTLVYLVTEDEVPNSLVAATVQQIKTQLSDVNQSVWLLRHNMIVDGTGTLPAGLNATKGAQPAWKYTGGFCVKTCDILCTSDGHNSECPADTFCEC